MFIKMSYYGQPVTLSTVIEISEGRSEGIYPAENHADVEYGNRPYRTKFIDIHIMVRIAILQTTLNPEGAEMGKRIK